MLKLFFLFNFYKKLKFITKSYSYFALKEIFVFLYSYKNYCYYTTLDRSCLHSAEVANFPISQILDKKAFYFTLSTVYYNEFNYIFLHSISILVTLHCEMDYYGSMCYHHCIENSRRVCVPTGENCKTGKV